MRIPHSAGHSSHRSDLVIDRYTRPEMGALWTDEAKIQQWLAVELSVCEAWARRGRIPADAMASIRGATCNLDRMREIERETDHDVIAFLRAVGETVGEASRFIHLGLTSSDVVDTGLGIQARNAGHLLLADLDRMIGVVGDRAIEHKRTITIGRSHGMHAEPTTFGLKLLVIFDELRRHRARLELAIADIAVGQISGAVGTHAHIPPDLEEEVCADLGLGVELASNQVVQRDRHAFFLSVLAGIAGTLEKVTVEIRHLQRTEVGEAEEYFGEGNQGSSAMPHKRNPHQSERIAGLARLVRGYAQTGFENVPLWHERDISHSSAERVIFPDACILLDFMLAETTELIHDLVVYPERMIANLESTGGLIYSQRILLALVDAGLDRQAAYKLVQQHAHAAWGEGQSFRDVIAADPVVQERLSTGDLEELFDPWQQLLHLDQSFDRLALKERANVAG
jgi:adenylosuccinate lyase